MPAIFSSGAVISLRTSSIQIIAALAAAILYIFHIRAIDEHRDFEHDNAYHSNRPIQTGVISREELKIMDIFANIIFIGIVISFGKYSALTGLVMLTYSYIAGKEFFVGEKVRKHYFFYNSINLVQMLLMQILIYTIFTKTISLSPLIATHFAFTSIGTIIFEFVRKLKIPGDDGIGKDTYTWFMGFNKAMFTYVLLLCLDGFLFFKIASLLSVHKLNIILLASGLTLASVAFACLNWIKKSHITDQLMQLFFLITYGMLNIAIYYIKFH